MTIANSGDGDANSAVISDTLDANLSFVDLGCPDARSTRRQPRATAADLPTLASGVAITAGEEVTLTFQAMVNSDAAGGTQIANTAAVTSSEVAIPVSGRLPSQSLHRTSRGSTTRRPAPGWPPAARP